MNNYMTESSYFFTTSIVEIKYFYSGFTTKKQEDIFHYIITGQSVQRSNRIFYVNLHICFLQFKPTCGKTFLHWQKEEFLWSDPLKIKIGCFVVWHVWFKETYTVSLHLVSEKQL